MNWRKITGGLVWLLTGFAGMQAAGYTATDFTATIALKTPGNAAVHYPLALQEYENSRYAYRWVPDAQLPVSVY